MNDIIVDKLLKEISKIAKVVLTEDNIFSILQIERKEVMHCRFLKYLICADPNGFFRDVLRLTLKDTVCGDNIVLEKATTPETDEDDGRIDIWIENNEYIIPIEVKIDAKDRKGQLSKYYNFALNESKNTSKTIELYYLTLNGKDPDIISYYALDRTQKLKEGQIKKISFIDIKNDKNIKTIQGWLENMQKKDGICFSKKLISDYMEILKIENERRKIMDKISESRENLLSSYQIAQNVSKSRASIAKEFFDALIKEVQCEMENKLGIKKGILSYVAETELVSYFSKSRSEVYCKISTIELKEYEFYIAATTNLYCGLRKNTEKKFMNGDWIYINNNCMADGTNERSKQLINVKDLGIDGDHTILNYYFWRKEGREKESQDIIKKMACGEKGIISWLTKWKERHETDKKLKSDE